MLDLYAGTGVMAMEAISRGARYADLVEVESRRSREIRENLRSMDLDGQTKVFTGRVMKVIASLREAMTWCLRIHRTSYRSGMV